MPLSRHQLGQQGESIAAHYIQHQLGWTLVAQNWRCSVGEIDLIAQDGPTLVFIEVRTRRGYAAMTKAFTSVDETKQAQLVAVIEAYQMAHDLDEMPMRLDVMGIALDAEDLFTIEIIHDALAS